jgi:nucleoside-diphosphate-sugar epimerase
MEGFAVSVTLSAADNVLVTGVTGLIGGEVYRRLLTGGHTGRVWALVRSRDGKAPSERLAERFRRSGVEPPAEAHAIDGDVLLPGWGLNPADAEEVKRSVNVIFHNAADTSFAAHREIARTNIDGVRHLIELARSCARAPLIVYMSTASNVGDVRGTSVGEEEGCQPGNRHHNEYTYSKAVAEALLRDSGLPVLTLRPTIVLSEGLPDARFARQILWCVPVTRAFEALPLDPAARLDIVDVASVADAAVRLAACPNRRWDCYHISAGLNRAITVGDMGVVVNGFYSRKKPILLIPPAQWDRACMRAYVRTDLQKRIFQSLRHYMPFFNMDVVYDAGRLTADLGAEAPQVAAPTQYLPELLQLIGTKAALREAAVP